MKTHLFNIAVALIVLSVAGFAFVLQSGKPRTWPEALREHMGPPEMSKVDPSKPLETQTRTFELAGRIFEIPLMYNDGRPKPGLHQTSLLLEVIWPEMRSLFHLKNRAEYDRIWRDEGRLGWILLHDPKGRLSLEGGVDSRRSRATKEEPLNDGDGLDGYLVFNKVWDEKPAHELYLEKSKAGELLSYIECTPKERARTPVCEHRFIENGIEYKISYRKDSFFHEWREQRRRAIEFLRRMEKPNETLNHGATNADTDPKPN